MTTTVTLVKHGQSFRKQLLLDVWQMQCQLVVYSVCRLNFLFLKNFAVILWTLPHWRKKQSLPCLQENAINYLSVTNWILSFFPCVKRQESLKINSSYNLTLIGFDDSIVFHQRGISRTQGFFLPPLPIPYPLFPTRCKQVNLPGQEWYPASKYPTITLLYKQNQPHYKQLL